MALKDNLQHIFNGDYPGIDVFVNNVIIPIMGNDIDYKNIDLAARTEYVEKATKAGIKRLVYVADITEQNYSSQNIALFDVTLDNSVNVERARVNIQQLIRSVVGYYNHILIVFHYEDPTGKAWRFSYAHKIDSQANTTSAKRYTYVFGRDFRARTAADRFVVLAKSNRTDKDFEEAFSVQALSDEFFDLYRAYYAAFVEFITGEKYTDEKKLNAIISRWNWLQKDDSDQFSTTFDNDAKDVRDYIKKMFGRIVFLYFLQRKGWLYDANGNSDARYMRHLFDGAGELKDTFLDDVLELLFFYVLNTKSEQRVQDASLAHKDITILPGWDKIPFLNGGLFSQDDIDPKKCVFPAVYFDELFRFLDSYNFTIDENDQEDAEVGIDPEMLGRIFENLLEDNKDKGAFYTPKEIVDYMCRESIIAYLQDDRFTESGNELIRQFIETLNIDLLDTKQRDYIEDRLLKVKICDPAIGSGAFPMGLVNLLSKIFIVLRTYKTIDQAKMKRYIMQQSIYGVDIEQGAVDIARLRFWLAMVVDENEPQPLPNLHFKIMQGNSLLESYKGCDLSDLTTFQTEVEQGTFDFGPNHESVELNSLLRLYYSESDHTKQARMLTSIRHNVIRQMLGKGIEIDKELDITSNNQFFLWHTWFADVFEKGGFDIVIGNPPYNELRDLDEYSQQSNKQSKYYEHAKGGRVNLFQFFYPLAIDILKIGGICSLITQNSLLGEDSALKNRELIFNSCKVLKIDSFPERDDVNKRVFKSAKMSVCIGILKKENDTEDLASYKFPVYIWKDKYMTEGYILNIYNTEIFDVYPNDKIIPICDNRRWDLLVKLKSQGSYSIIAQAGEIDMTKYRNVFSQDSTLFRVLTGAQVQRYFITNNPSQGQVFYIDQNKLNLSHERNEAIANPRIVMQRITGVDSKVRLISTLVPANVLCANSTNYISTTKNSYNIYALLGLLNSKLLNFFIKQTSTNTNVTGKEIAGFPIKHSGEYSKKIIDLVTNRLLNRATNLDNEIDHIVYHLYELTYDEVLIVDPETPLTREQYENFKLQ